MVPQTLRTLIDVLGATTSHPLPDGVAFAGVGLDSRTLSPGEVFFAVAGEHRDGHEFLEDAFRAGAVAAVCREANLVADHTATNADRVLIEVSDPTTALGRFAEWYRRELDPLVIGVTGSVGKTTTRHLLHTVLSQQHVGITNARNFNNRFGVPLSLLETEAEHEFNVIELAASGPNEIEPLAKIAEPEIGIVTAIGPAHLRGFGSEAEVLRTKLGLLRALPSGSLAVVDGDHDSLSEAVAELDVRPLRVGRHPRNDLVADAVEVTGTELLFRANGVRFSLPHPCRHLLTSALATIAVAREVGLSDETILKGFDKFVPVAGRVRIVQHHPWTVIDDTYNSNPMSLRAAIGTLSELPMTGKRILVTGDMLDLGPHAERLHEGCGEAVASSGIDLLITHGLYGRDLIRGARRAGFDSDRMADCPGWDTLLLTLRCWLEPGDTLLVKGSRGMRMERVFDSLNAWATSLEPAA